MKNITLLFSVLFVFATQSYATELPAANWEVNDEVSNIRFIATYNAEDVTGYFSDFDANIYFQKENPEKSWVDVTVKTGSIQSDNTDAKSTLPAVTFFDVEAFPTATFKTAQIEHIEGSKYIAEGELTIKEHTKPVRLVFELLIEGDTATMHGSTTLQRLDYELGEGEWESIENLAPEVKVMVELTATKQAAVNQE